MRRIFGTIGATLAIVALVATSAAPAGAQSAIEYALMGGFRASGTGGPESAMLGWAGRLDSDAGLKSGGNAGTPADASGGYIYRNGRYTALDTVDGLVTAHVAIDNRGQTVGAYFRSEVDAGGFVRSRMGRYTRFDVAPGPATVPLDINDRGTIIGLTGDAATGEAHAFLRTPNGAVSTAEIPGARLTRPFGINDRGAIAGAYVDADGINHAYLMQKGKLTTIVPPDAPDDPAVSQTLATDVNDRGQVVGCYADANGTTHGFRDDNGRFTTIDPPGGANIPDYATTCPFGINNRSQIVGQYVDATGVLHGYLWQPGRGFQTVDAPPGAQLVGPTGIKGTIAADINDRGEILLPIPGGLYKEPPATTHG
jgi:probable HAF family extracellular repeat protein